MLGLLVVIAFVGLVVLGPLGFIWAVNTLFGLAIPYGLKTWAAAFLLTASVAAPKK